MSEQVSTLPVEEGQLDEFYITPPTEEDDNGFFVTGAQRPGEMYVETPQEHIYRVHVSEEGVSVQNGDMTRDGFIPAQEPVRIAKEGLVTILGQPRSHRSRQSAVEEFDISASGGTLSIFSDKQPIRVIAPAKYFWGSKRESN
jgi:hypothetical protein